MTEKDSGLERLTNLTFAFLNADQLGRQFLTSAWVRRNVSGYEYKTGDAFDKAFQRDRMTLTKVGVPIETVADAAIEDGECVTGYRLQQEEYSLPEVSFTPAEATVLGLAGERGTRGELSAFTRSGWTKIAAAGANRNLEDAGLFSSSGDLDEVSAQTLDLVVSACARGRRLTFSYAANQAATPQERHLDPWGLVPLRGRMYLVGFDVDREAVRSFRITRLSAISASGATTHPMPPSTNVQGIVEESLRRGKQLVSATLQITPGAAPLVAAQGTVSGDTLSLVDVDKDWLVRSCISYAPDVLVLFPPELREEVIAGLRASLAAHQAGDS